MTDATRTLIQMSLDLLRVALVYGLFAVLLLMLMANWSLPYFTVFKPQIVLIAVFYWTLYRPSLMPPWVVFATGLLLDAVNPAVPMGTHALSYLLILGLLKPRRRMLMGQPFMMIWVGFIAVMVIDMAIKVAVMSILTASRPSTEIILLNGLVTILVFPMVLMLLVFVHRFLPAGRGMVVN